MILLHYQDLQQSIFIVIKDKLLLTKYDSHKILLIQFETLVHSHKYRLKNISLTVVDPVVIEIKKIH